MDKTKQTNKKQKHKGKRPAKKLIFWRIYLSVVIVLLLIIAGVWFTLIDFLKYYESAQPTHLMDALVKEVQEGTVDELLAYSDATYSEDKTEEVKQSILASVDKETLAYTMKRTDNSDEEPVYRIYDVDGEICLVTLRAKEERAKYDSKVWEVKSVDDLVKPLEPITIVAPQNYIVEVNGEALAEDSAIESTLPAEIEALEEIELISKYTDFPTVNTYHIEELYVEPEIVCYVPDKSATVTAEESENTYTFQAVSYETLDAGMQEEIKEFSKKYVKYCTGDVSSSEVLTHVISNTVTAKRLSAISSMNVWTPKHSAVQFSDMEIYDYRRYSETFFACKLHFTYMIPYMMGDSSYETDLTYYYLLVDGKWKIAEMIIE